MNSRQGFGVIPGFGGDENEGRFVALDLSDNPEDPKLRQFYTQG